ncbi:MAG TPA: hypothetical protein VHM19_16605, partial [Polyangiales bacterium]|nr:hypothetical protein [Polyangiales bacterium]
MSRPMNLPSFSLCRGVLVSLCVAFFAAAIASPVAADAPKKPQNPVDAANGKLAEKAARAGKEARGVVPLLMLWDHWDEGTPSVLVSQLEKLAKDARLSPDRRVLVQTMLGQAKLRLGDAEAVHAPFEKLGYVTHF